MKKSLSLRIYFIVLVFFLIVTPKQYNAEEISSNTKIFAYSGSVNLEESSLKENPQTILFKPSIGTKFLLNGQTGPNVHISLISDGNVVSETVSLENGNFQFNLSKQLIDKVIELKVNSNGNVKSYFIAVKMISGWLLEDGYWYYFKPSAGGPVIGWFLDRGTWYHFDKQGRMETGWILDNGKWYYLEGNGSMKTGWLLYKGSWFYLNSNGTMRTGWMREGAKWYFFSKQGIMQKGWLWDERAWYFLNNNGVMQTGWIYNGGSWYLLSANGVMEKGWKQVAGKWYFLDSGGKMKTGWIQSQNNWYYLNSHGYLSSVILSVPLIAQQPELPRGCEVTSLAMMLQYGGVNVSKMTLASQVKKDPTPYSKVNNQVYFGNPYDGFVGDMYSFSNPGYGVYNGPIAQLAEKYMPNRIVDFTGSNFDKVYDYLESGKPVWIINNVMFDTVPSQYWRTWNTPSGKIQITMKEHSVLVTGYDDTYIYFNDPLAVIKNRKISKQKFIRGWEQMGKQAISFK